MGTEKSLAAQTNWAVAVVATALMLAPRAARPDIVCAGDYPNHLQGVATDDAGNICWSFTTVLVKTDASGTLLASVTVPSHYGDLTWRDHKIYVAVNYGKFNEEPGQADSWVRVHDDTSLALLEEYALPEVVHGAGGMEWHDGRFFVVGGLPPGHTVNYVYEYTSSFVFVRRHEIASGYTTMGIQTVCRDRAGIWWFGCYGSPAVILAADENFKLLVACSMQGAYGLARTPEAGVLLAAKSLTAAGRYGGAVAPLAMPRFSLPYEEGDSASSAAIRVYTSATHNLNWMTVHTNEVGLCWNWPDTASRASLEVAGMHSSFATNFSGAVTGYLYRAVVADAPVRDDVLSLTLIFYDGKGRAVITNSAELAVLAAVFGNSRVVPGAEWSRVSGSAVIAYDGTWPELAGGAVPAALNIAKKGEPQVAHALRGVSGFFARDLRGGGWGYGDFDLRLVYEGSDRFLSAAVRRVFQTMTVSVE